ncbi:MAG TPA: phosphate acyltransferase PlsX [Streptosporangiaceae bacterium]|nr:phosphate acyltransferase PlsX [Streptosporangiaceae bacterium]
MGGDHAPDQVVAGAVAAVREHQVRVVLTGQPTILRHLLAEQGADRDIPIVPADDVLSMEEGALASWRRPRSSLAVGCQLIRRGQAGALVSAGSTAAVVATARLRLRSLPGVLRPALAVVLPTEPTPTVLLDAGATADPKPEMLVQFAHLGVAYAQIALGIERPSVGLLTIGSEPGKGNKLARRTHELLTAAATERPGGEPALSFAGNMEGDDLLAGRVDVVVSDGFTGNVALKTLEGTVRFAAQQLRGIMTSSPAARIGARLQRGRLRSLATRLDPESQGGAALLGLHGTVVIAHGAATAKGVASACVLAASLADGHIADRIKDRVGHARTGFLRRS